MILYLSIMALMLAFCLNASQKHSIRKTILAFGLLLLGCLMALKGSSVGNDTENYIYFFKRIGTSGKIYDAESRFEIGYQIYSKLVFLFFNQHQYLFVSTAIICLTCIYSGIFKFSNNAGFSLFLFVSLRFFYFFLSGLRQSIAVSIIFFSVQFLFNKKTVKFVIAILLAMSFHLSSIIFLFAWPISKMKFSFKGLLIVIGTFLLAFFLFDPLLSIAIKILPKYYAHYLQSAEFSAGNLANYLNVFLKFGFVILMFFLGYPFERDKKYCFDEEKKINIHDTFAYFMIASVCLEILATKASILDRLVQYYWIFSILALPQMLQTNRIPELFGFAPQPELMDFDCALRLKRESAFEKKLLRWAIIITVAITIAYNLIILIFRPNWNMVVPYRFFWE